MRILSKQNLDKLNKIYKTNNIIFGEEELYSSDKYDFSRISVFDHQLTNEEAEKQILFYQHALEEGDTTHTKQYYKYHDQFLRFYLDLYDKTTVYGVHGMFSEKYIYGIEFDSIEGYKWHVLASIREQVFLRIVLPEFYSVIEGNFDLGHLLYTLKPKLEEQAKIGLIIKKHGLFTI